MTENPFQPPSPDLDSTDGVAANTRLGSEERKVLVPGGFLTVSVIAVATGLLVGWGIPNSNLNPFIVVAIAMLIANSVCVVLLRGLKISLAAKVSLIGVLSLASYILFVPSCTAGGFVMMLAGLDQQYGPSEVGLLLSSLLTSVIILNLVIGIGVHFANRQR